MDRSEVEDLIVYTTEGCGRCTILKNELNKNNISYTESQDYPKGMSSAPMLKVGDNLLLFKEAMDTIPELKKIYAP